MAFVRIILLVLVVAIAAGAILFLVTRDRRYLRFSLHIAKWAVAAALVGFGLLALEKMT